MLDQSKRIADGVRAGGAGSGDRGIRPFRARANRHVTGRQIDDGRGNEKGRNPARPVVEVGLILTLDDIEAADSAADVDTDTLLVVLRDLAPGRSEREFS